jgi:DNA-binding CsgD family transcriptional regulator
MDRSKRKLIRQLERLQAQIDKLKQNYLIRINTGQPEKQAVEKADLPSPSPPDDKLQEKNQKLLELTIRTGKENELYKAVSKKLKIMLKSGKTAFSQDDLQEIQQAMEQLRGKTDNWEIFKQKFSAVHKDFFDKLEAAHPGLTKTELKFCAYLRIRMTSQQIASVMNISMEAIRKSRYRIRKKLGLKTEDSLEEHINRF